MNENTVGDSDCCFAESSRHLHFVNIRNSAPRKALPPPEIAVDISDFTPPVPREMPTPEQSLQGESRDGRSMNPGTVSKAVSAEQLSEGAMHDFTPEAEQVNPLLGQTVTERKMSWRGLNGESGFSMESIRFKAVSRKEFCLQDIRREFRTADAPIHQPEGGC